MDENKSEKLINKKGFKIGLIIIAILGIVCIVIGTIIAINANKDVNIKGKYELVQIEEDGRITEKEDIDVLKEFKLYSNIEFNEDKTGNLMILGEDTSFTYDNKYLYATEEKMEYSVNEDKIVVNRSNSKLTFEKEK